MICGQIIFGTSRENFLEAVMAKRLRQAVEESLTVAKMVLRESVNDLQMLTLITEIAYRTSTPEDAIDAFHQLESLGEAKLFHIRRYANAAIKAASPNDMFLSVQRLIELEVDANATVRNSFLKLHELGATEKAEEILDLIQGTLLEIDLRAAIALERETLSKHFLS